MKSIVYNVSYNSVIEHIIEEISKISKENKCTVEPSLLCGNLLSFKIKNGIQLNEVTFVVRKDYDNSVIVDVFSSGDLEWSL